MYTSFASISSTVTSAKELDDVEVAKQYGNFIYEIDVPEHKMCAFQRDSLYEHYISSCLIPISEFKITKQN